MPASPAGIAIEGMHTATGSTGSLGGGGLEPHKE
jgi:hypothetical protein